MFKKYSSLTNTYNEKMLRHLRNTEAGAGLFQVTEKIHGANFSFIVTKDGIQIASRNGIKEGNFFNCAEMVEEQSPKMLELYKELDEPDCLTVYGEIYGSNIQAKMDYGDEVKFACFDICVNGKYLDTDATEYFTTLFNIPTAHLFGTMTLDEALAIPNEFPSHHSPSGCNCEGLVIKPVETAFWASDERIALKSKNDKFTELDKAKKVPKVVELTEEGNATLAILVQYVNDNRIDAVLSKEAEVNFKLFGMLLGKVMKDVYLDVSKEVEDIPKPNRLVNKLLTKQIEPLLRKAILARQ